MRPNKMYHGNLAGDENPISATTEATKANNIECTVDIDVTQTISALKCLKEALSSFNGGTITIMKNNKNRKELLDEVRIKLNKFGEAKKKFTGTLECSLLHILVELGQCDDGKLTYSSKKGDSDATNELIKNLNRFYENNILIGSRMLCFQEDNYVLAVKYTSNKMHISYEPYVDWYDNKEFIGTSIHNA